MKPLSWVNSSSSLRINLTSFPYLCFKCNYTSAFARNRKQVENLKLYMQICEELFILSFSREMGARKTSHIYYVIMFSRCVFFEIFTILFRAETSRFLHAMHENRYIYHFCIKMFFLEWRCAFDVVIAHRFDQYSFFILHLTPTWRA